MKCVLNTLRRILVLKPTSEENDWQRREDQVIQQDERVLVQVGGVETDGTELTLATMGMDDAHLLKGRNQNMANTQITFCPIHQYM